MKSELLVKGYYVATEVLSECQHGCVERELPAVESAGTRLLLDIEFFAKLANQLKKESILASALKDLSAVQCIFFHKNTEYNWSVQLHRDTVVPVKGSGPWPPAGVKEGLNSAKPPFDFLNRCLVVRVALDDCEDGDLTVSPYSHLSSDLNAGYFSLITVPRRGALVFRPTLLHSSKKLVHSKSRRVLHYLFAPSKPPHNYRWYHVV